MGGGITCILEEKDHFNLKNRKHRNKNQASQIITQMNPQQRMMLLPPVQTPPTYKFLRYDNISNQDNNEAKIYTPFLLNQSSLLLFSANLKANTIIHSFSKFVCTNKHSKSPELVYIFKLNHRFFY